jgi:hypothetical protein
MKVLLNMLISGAIISLSTLLAEKKPGLAGIFFACHSPSLKER